MAPTKTDISEAGAPPSPVPFHSGRRWRLPAQILVAGTAIVWILHEGRLDVASLRAQLGWRTFLPWAGLYAVVQLTQTLRWYWYCRAMDLPLRFGSALRQMAVGMFWGAFTPALVGVDLSRAVTMRRAFPGRTGPAALAILADRLTLMVASLLLSALALPFAWPLAASHPALLTLATGTALAGILLFLAMFGLILAPLDRLHRLPGMQRLIAGRLARTYAALRHFRGQMGVLWWGLALGLLGQGLCIGLIGMLLGQTPGRTVSWANLLLIVPLGWHAMSLPVAPAGLGVGQVAFDRLFTWAGCLPGVGATVVTTYQISLLAVHLLAGLAWFWPDEAPAPTVDQ